MSLPSFDRYRYNILTRKDGFGGFATRFVDPALGFATGYVYFFKYLLAAPNQLSAFALIFQVRHCLSFDTEKTFPDVDSFGLEIVSVQLCSSQSA